VFKISGGNDKQGFCMTQGVLISNRVRLLMKAGMPGYRQRRKGERKRKSVRGCIVSSDLSVLNLVVVKKGDGDIEGVTDDSSVKPRRLGPKRASRIRKLFNLTKEDDVRQFVVRRQIIKDGKKPTFKAPKIQRLVTPQRLQRKRHLVAVKRQRYEKTKAEAAAYNELLAMRRKEQSQSRAAKLAQRRSSRKLPEAAVTGTTATSTPSRSVTTATQPAAKPAASAVTIATSAPAPAPKVAVVKPAAPKAATSKPASAKKAAAGK